MRTAIDSSVLFSVLNREANGEAWLKRLVECRREGQLLVCDVVYAEISQAFISREETDDALLGLGILYDRIGEEAAFEAGRIFKRYRDAGGPRAKMIADFLIAAHGRIHADRLAVQDDGFFRQHFRGLSILALD
jgi:predicted nucleic acid-binding protein